ncbi:MAG: Rrf2 family transcriptional regulator [Acidimicrobiaceae bacterium]|nr:Rrf2 family transcriptional regulator [Acidimicrobiaceae bacterium]
MRLEITRRAELAVRAMAFLGGTTERVKGSVLANELGSTSAFVAQVVGPLVKAGWVQSDPGPSGGYVNRVSLDELSVLDVIEVVDGVTDTGRCVVVDRLCDSESPCALHNAWSHARAELTKILGDMSLSDVAAGARL